MGRQLHIPFAECLRVESNFDEQNKFFGEQFHVKYFKYRIRRQFQDVSDIQMGWFHA